MTFSIRKTGHPTMKSSPSRALSTVAYGLVLLVPVFITVIIGLVPLKNFPTNDVSVPPFDLLQRANVTEYTLRSAPFPSLFYLFLSLPPPSGPLHGEYLAEILDAGSLAANVLGWIGFTPFFPGAWIGKSFVEATDEKDGWGYNVFRWFGARLDRRFKMHTSITTSVWDGRPSFQLQYAGETHLLGRLRMRDEVREIQPGLYLGMGTFGYSEAKRRDDPLPFLLRGPYQAPVPGAVRESFWPKAG
jgi:hypothetical protein